MTTLREQLEDVADQADGPVPQPGDLWGRGHRWRRRRRAGTAGLVGAACLALVGLGFAGWQTSHQDELRPADAPAGLPDRVWAPSPTLPGTDSTGPLGRLALVISAERAGWWGSEYHPVAISAATGEYAFLDLPRWAQGHALSPDGRSVAYWVAGSPSGEPPEARDDKPVTGFAVYDAATGETRIQEIETEHGLWADGLTWADSATLVVNFSQIVGGRGDSDMDQSSASPAPMHVWRLEEDEAAADPALDALLLSEPDGGGYGRVWTSDYNQDDAWRVVDARNPAAAPGVINLPDPSSMYTTAVDASGTRMAGVTGNRNPSRVRWSESAGSKRVVPDTEWTFRVVAWLDESRVLLLRSPNDARGGERYRPSLMAVDVETGDSTTLTSPVDQASGDSSLILGRDVSVAWELATEPTFEASEPPDPISQRALLFWALAAVVAAALGLRWWRRRVEP